MTEKTFEEAWEEIKSLGGRERDTIEVAEGLVRVINDLVALRNKRGLSQKQVAQMCGLRQPALSRIESLRMIPRVDTLIKITRCLGAKVCITDNTEYHE